MNGYNNQTRRGLYRSRNGIIMGVCRGVAEYFHFSVFWVRATAIILFIFTGFWPIVGIYILAALLMKPTPVKPIAAESKKWQGTWSRCRRTEATGRLRRQWQHLEKRIRRMEEKVTSQEFDWNSRLHG